MEKKQLPALNFQALFEGAPGLYLVLRSDLTIVAVSDAYLRATMTQRENILGHGLFEIFPDNPDDPHATGASNVRASMQRVLKRRMPDRMEVLKYDIRKPLEEGGAFEERYWRPLNTPVLGQDGQVDYIIHQAEDVTEVVRLERRDVDHENAEQTLRESAEWFSTALSSIGDAVIATDTDGRVKFMNGVAEELTGWAQEQASGKDLEEVFRIVNDQTKETPENAVTKVLKLRDSHYRGLTCFQQSGQVGKRVEVTAMRRDGSIFPAEIAITPIQVAHKQFLTACIRDISARKATEEAHARLFQELKTNDRRKDEFLAMLAHELRNPLAAVYNAVTVIKMSKDSESRIWASDVVERQVKQLARLIDDLLDVSRISSGKIRLRKETVDLAPIVAYAVEATRPLLDERKHQLDVCCGPGLFWVDADPTRLEQIVVNLLTNAIKYTESGGRIALTVANEENSVLIKVRDTGIGITPELILELFGLFAQGDRALDRAEGGLGIGLTIAQKLAELHGGNVAAASEGVGKGSEFTVRLPVASRPQAAELPCLSMPGSCEKKRSSRILVVDDNVDTAKTLAKLLKLIGHDIEMVHDGGTAVQAAFDFRPEIILLDIGLPTMDGYQVAMTLREAGMKDTLIIAVSGYGREEDRRRSKEAGFDHHLVKPVDYDALVSLIAERV